jgi:uncharacterized repeat protein (TIGR03803 family)
MYKLSPDGKETVLYQFKGGTTDGLNPGFNVALDGAGNIYGVTSLGGADNQGTVFKLTPSGQESILHSFTDGADGASPTGIAIDSMGNLYGTTFAGGAGSRTDVQEGVVFKIDTAGNFSVLYSFAGLSDGGNPDGGVTLDSAGNLYGTTYSGGLGAGVVFKVDATGAYSVLHAFSVSTDGGDPTSVTLDSAGNLYGTCAGYGPNGGGTVFKVDTVGSFSVVYAFTVGKGTGNPTGVVIDKAGNLYGSISSNDFYCPGTPDSCGLVYRIDPSGSETVLYSFTGRADGAGPGRMTLDATGHIYGTAAGLLPVIPAGGGGVAFRIRLP